MSELLSRDAVSPEWGRVAEGFHRTQRLLAADVESHGLNYQWFEVLVRLLHAEDHRLPMNRLATDINMTSGGYTKLVDRMESAGVVERVPAANDRRVIYTALTDAGSRLATESLTRYEETLQRTVLAVIDPAELATVASIMTKLCLAFADDASPADDDDETAASA